MMMMMSKEDIDEVVVVVFFFQVAFIVVDVNENVFFVCERAGDYLMMMISMC
jgi:hypothetical protein